MLIGLLTRSTLAAILVTGVFWALIFGVNITDNLVIPFPEGVRLEVEEREERIDLATTNTEKLILRRRSVSANARRDPGPEPLPEQARMRSRGKPREPRPAGGLEQDRVRRQDRSTQNRRDHRTAEPMDHRPRRIQGLWRSGRG
ncbi:unnamed protein product [Ectocarpus fasciculatus]